MQTRRLTFFLLDYRKSILVLVLEFAEHWIFRDSIWIVVFLRRRWVLFSAANQHSLPLVVGTRSLPIPAVHLFALIVLPAAPTALAEGPVRRNDFQTSCS